MYRCSFILIAQLALVASILERDPYEVLGVGRRDTDSEIKKSYRELTKTWHPDRNQSPEAAEKFMEIQSAYELLSDPERRERYDRTGSLNLHDDIDDARHFHGSMDDFIRSMMFGSAHFSQTTQESMKLFNQRRMTIRMYEHSILEKSWTQPQLLLIYADWCAPCVKYAAMWQTLLDDLLPIGFGMQTVNKRTDGTLTDKLRVHQLPSLVILSDGRTLHYRGEMTDRREIIDFCRQAINPVHVRPINFVREIASFVDQWQKTNKISVLMVGSRQLPRIRLLLAAMAHNRHAHFAYIHAQGIDDYEKLRQILSIDKNAMETLLIFDDLPGNGPIARLSSLTQITADAMHNLIKKYKNLILPRLSSQHRFEELCPVTGDTRNSNSVKLCCVLVVNDAQTILSDYKAVNSLRQWLADAKDSNANLRQRVKFSYAELAKQGPFLTEMLEKTPLKQNSDDVTTTDILILSRITDTRARYSCLEKFWMPASINASAERLTEMLQDYLSGERTLNREVALKQLNDEHAPSFLQNLSYRTMRVWETLVFHASKEEILPAVSAIGTLVVILLLGYVLNYMSQKEEIEQTMQRERLKKAREERQKAQGIKPKTYDDILRELRGETYFGMVRLLKPGCRTLVVLVSSETKDTILPEFRRCVWPWRNNKSLMFGYLVVPKNIEWFKMLLAHTISVNEEDPDSYKFETFHKKLQNIQANQTIGTVLALNGWRTYFCMYHPMHAPSLIGYKPRAPKTSAKNFIGFDDEDTTSDDSDTDYNNTSVENAARRRLQREMSATPKDVLTGLPNWLDRLFDGQMRRYYLPEWPDIK